MLKIRNALIIFYLEFVNEWITYAAYAEYHNISITDCEKLLDIGRQFHKSDTE